MNISQTFKYLARRYKNDDRPELEAILDKMAKKYTRKDLTDELVRLAELKTWRPLTERHGELVRRCRQRSFRPLDTRYRRTKTVEPT